MSEPATAHQVEALFRITQNRYRKDEQDLHAFIADCRVKLRGKVPLKEEEVNAIKHIWADAGIDNYAQVFSPGGYVSITRYEPI